MSNTFTPLYKGIGLLCLVLSIFSIFIFPDCCFAQKDIKIELLSPTNGQQILNNKPFNFKVRIQNLGSELISYIDPIGIDAKVLGVTFYSTIMPHGDLVPGDTVSYSEQISYNFTNDHPSETFCTSAIILGNLDPNESDNFACNLVSLLQHPTHVKEQDLSAFNITPSPNPSNGILQLISNAPYGKRVNLCLYNTLGKIFCQKQSVEMDDFIDLSNLPKGVYYLNITDDNSQLVKKIILN